MKNNAIFINTSRASVVDEGALADAVREKKLRVGIDVYDNEPTSGDNSFSASIIDERGVYGTHHVGASTSQAQDAIASEAVRIIETFVREGRVIHCVNQSMKDTTSVMLSIRHKNLPGVLAHIFDELSIAGINVEEMENILYEGNQAACARIQLSAIPTPAQLTVIKDHENILSVTITT
jgi:D-3-phosphoglycerate dehydrogenase